MNKKKSDELIRVNTELAFQNEEKGKRAAELIIANAELAFQNGEKQHRAEELIVANKELAFQNEEKQNRADELFIANKELAFQNEEKERRAEELTERTQQLEAINKELESFSYSVSHDLRAPLRAINGFARILEEEYTANMNPSGIEIIQSVLRNSKKMGDLIDDLLAFSRLGRKEVTLSQINMNALVDIAAREIMSGYDAHRVNLKINPLPPSNGDFALIKQVWLNLLSNAFKYSKYKEKAEIEIGAFEEDHFVVYYIKDKGVGFNMQYYGKLFGVFQRLHSQAEFEGTGIGLANVQKIVQRHHGKVWAESKLNEGTCFYFSLPDIHN
jgi:light-regulated signal transduction histidine kinase (bacteriophytochrome)